jgi:hypothetical protein
LILRYQLSSTVPLCFVAENLLRLLKIGVDSFPTDLILRWITLRSLHAEDISELFVVELLRTHLGDVTLLVFD